MYGRNPFEDDEDDSSFETKSKKAIASTPNEGGLNHGRSCNPFDQEGNRHVLDNKNVHSEYESTRRMMLVKQKMNNQLETTSRCLATVCDSEAIGIATAEELLHQGEKLDNIEQNVDKIIDNTKESQKHINSIKSVFGSLKNWWNGENKKQPSTSSLRVMSNSTLDKALSSVTTQRREEHPAVKSKGYDVKGFYNTDVVEYKDYDPENSGRSSLCNEVKSIAGTTIKVDTWKEYEEGLETNLNMISNGLGNLKNLALGLGEEITCQNEQLGRITEKADRSDAKIRNQNMQMKRILGK